MVGGETETTEWGLWMLEAWEAGSCEGNLRGPPWQLRRESLVSVRFHLNDPLPWEVRWEALLKNQKGAVTTWGRLRHFRSAVRPKGKKYLY